ncbi:hypothetical protein CB1_001341002 [Camelus ferus]|nr:hypothetical protein CB1_001341002 [Camelus ferus]
MGARSGSGLAPTPSLDHSCLLKLPNHTEEVQQVLGGHNPAQSQVIQKPKVYQGVRVKITVKELLQQRRAHQAASGGTTPGSSSDSSMLSGSLDYSYSPAQLPSYAPENYNSPPSLDTRNCGYSSEDCSYPHLPSHTQCDPFSSATASVCYCASCEAEHLDPFRVSEYFSHPSTDYGNFAPSAAATSDLYQRGANWDICYS